MSEGKATLYKKLSGVLGRLERVPETGYNTHYKYKYATAGDVSDQVRRALSAENVAFWANLAGVTRQDTETARGTPQVHTIVDVDFTFACGDTGESITTRWQGESLDTSDKGLNKATTAAEKYFFLKTFIISTGEDDADAESPEAPAKRQPAKPTKRQQPAETLTEQLDRFLARVNDKCPPQYQYRHAKHVFNTLVKHHENFKEWPKRLTVTLADELEKTLVEHAREETAKLIMEEEAEKSGPEPKTEQQQMDTIVKDLAPAREYHGEEV